MRFQQISFISFESPDGKSFQVDRDSHVNYFDETNIPSKKTTYIIETDIKNFLYETKRLVNIGGLKTNFENFGNLLINTGSSFDIVGLTETWCNNFGNN